MASTATKWVTRLFINSQIFLYRRSKGKMGGMVLGFPVLLLTTIGRKSGLARTTPVIYLRDGNDYLIAASAAGADKNPIWFSNLQSKPEASIEVDGQTFNVRVEVTGEPERAELYERFKAKGDNFVQYQQKTNRPIPVIRLTPIT
jgi:F420H(2)-dependent quinone reductase